MCRVSTKGLFFVCKICLLFVQIFVLRNFAQYVLRIFCVISAKPVVLRKTYIFMQNMVLTKLTKIDSFSTKSNQLKVYSKMYTPCTNKLWFCCYQFVTVGLQNLQIEVQKLIKQKLEIWKLKMDDSFYRCLNLSVVLNFDVSNVDYF